MVELNESEHEVLRILWESEELKPAEIQALFAWDIENPTLRSVLRNLVENGMIARHKQGKAFVYRARARRATQFTRAMQRMAEIFTGGSRTGLILELLQREKLSDKERQLLQEIVDRNKPNSN